MNIGKIYRCPMHPEVQSEKAGSCPKCGMNLVLIQKEQKGHEKQAGMGCGCC